MLERPGEVVTREELRQRIWPEKSFGDFDHAINLAITKLRATLGDSAGVPHLIETLPRRGYRFIAPLKEETDPFPSDGASSLDCRKKTLADRWHSGIHPSVSGRAVTDLPNISEAAANPRRDRTLSPDPAGRGALPFLQTAAGLLLHMGEHRTPASMSP